ncbi:MAG TPA: DoxX family protein [Gemmataceae bacterium]|nr:DoxX family protein [Gemmataceae bacterium]
MHRLLYPGGVTVRGSLGLLLLRLAAGSAFMCHGWYKIVNEQGEFAMFQWMGPKADVPGFMQGLAAFCEFGGGLAWVLGLLTPLASLGIICVMVTAITKVHLHDPFVRRDLGPTSEPAVGYLAVALLLLLAGPGMFSLDALLFRKRRSPTGQE